jgi:hypothetical protein
MDKHKLTDGHRRRAGQDDGYGEGGEMVKRERFPCSVPGCGSTFNREDNLRQHVGRKHALDGLGGMGRAGRRGGGRAVRLGAGMGV